MANSHALNIVNRMALHVVIMAAGKGTRMKSQLPKVLHRLGGRTLLQHVLDAAAALKAERTIVITGHGADAVEAAVAPSGATCVRQMPQLGTGHAIQQVVPLLPDDDSTVLILENAGGSGPDVTGVLGYVEGGALSILASPVYIFGDC